MVMMVMMLRIKFFLSIFKFSAEVLNACHFSAMILTYLNKYRTEKICIHR